MASDQISIRDWAVQLKVPHELLLKQLSAAGWDKSSPDDQVTQQEMASARKIILKAMMEAKRSPVSRPAAPSSVPSSTYRPSASRPPAPRPEASRPAAQEEAGGQAHKASASTEELRRFEQVKKDALQREGREREEAVEQARISAEKRAMDTARRLEEEQKSDSTRTAGTAAPGSKAGFGTPARRPAPDRGGGRRRPPKHSGRRRKQVVNPFERESQPDGVGSLHTRSEETEPQQFQSREVKIPETIQVSALAHTMSMKASKVVGTLMEMGVVATATQVIDQDTAVLVVEELGHRAVPVEDTAVESKLREYLASDSGMGPRPPIVTVMGHIDHGKTTLLDYIRKASVASSEAAGITQHIGAYQADTPSGVITFIDTPGHAAFTSLRARGAKVTDLVVLVVAGDDGVMPQTQEAIEHARVADVPIVVAINKMDKPQANPDKVKEALASVGLQAEDWGGDVQMIPVSATTGEGVDKLLEALLIEAEVREFKAAHEGLACGVVLESTMSTGRGPTATLLVQQGRLQVGDPLLAGTVQGKVRAMTASAGKSVKVAEVSMPVEVLGFPSVPNVGMQFAVVADNRLMREVADYRINVEKQRKAVKEKVSLDSLFSAGDARMELSLVIKSDVQGSMEAVQQALEVIGDDTAGIRVVAGGVGGIAESDVHLAHTVKGIVLGFNVRADAEARRTAAEQGVEIRYYSTIYELIEDVEQALLGLLGPELREQTVGIAEVKEVFTSSQFGQIAGCMVVEGMVQRDKPVRVLRDDVVIFEGKLSSLRRFKEDVQEVRNGTECGIGIERYRDVRPGDRIEIFSVQEVQRAFKKPAARAAGA